MYRFERNGFDPERKNPSPSKDPVFLDMRKISGGRSLRSTKARSRNFDYYCNNYKEVKTAKKAKTPRKVVEGPFCCQCGESHAEMGSRADLSTPRDRCQRCIRNVLVYGFEWPIRKSASLKLDTPIVPLYLVHVFFSRFVHSLVFKNDRSKGMERYQGWQNRLLRQGG